MAFAVEQDERRIPQVGPLGSQAVVLYPQAFPHLVEESRGLVRYGGEVYNKSGCDPITIAQRCIFNQLAGRFGVISRIGVL